MNIQNFLEHHGVRRNPFAEEDAQTDPVFKEFCIRSAYHPVWDKVYGDPTEPATAIVFGPKGSGKTAMRLQIDQHLQRFNQEHPDRQVFVIRYDDFNPFLDHFQSRMSGRVRRKPEKVFEAWRLWDHMDAILCLAVTRMADQLVGRSAASNDGPGTQPSLSNSPQRQEHLFDPARVDHWDRASARDLLMLACCYDQSTSDTFTGRWNALRKRLRYRNWWVGWDLWLLVVWIIGTLLGTFWLVSGEHLSMRNALWLAPLVGVIGAAPFGWRWLRCQWIAMRIHRHMRVGKREISSLRKVLMKFPPKELASQPLPRFDRTDDRYELLNKLQALLGQLGFSGTIVLMDRVDEPHLTSGQPELMRRFVWPLLDNKLLKQPGIGFKLMLPQELYRSVEREGPEFHERARLDKQNVIPSFAWTGEALFDLMRNRMQACALEDQSPDPRAMFDEAISFERLLAVFQSLRVPRHLFRFLYRLLVEHCNKFTEAEPRYRIDAQTFEAVLALYQREITS